MGFRVQGQGMTTDEDCRHVVGLGWPGKKTLLGGSRDQLASVLSREC